MSAETRPTRSSLRDIRPAAELVAHGRAALPSRIPRTAFCRARGVASERDFKLRCRAERRITYHMHLGLNTWLATRDALHEITDALAEDGYTVDRFGLCLDRGMSLPAPARAAARKETGPRLTSDDWTDVANAVPIQPHLGDFMIGTPSGLDNSIKALGAGITTIGNLGQYFAFDTPGGHDDVATTEATVMALGAMAGARDAGALVHSYLDDGPAMQFSHYGAYVAWAALELYVIEELLGARLAHCFGGLVPEPSMRAVLSFALDELRGGDSIGSMIYGNTVDYSDNHVHNTAVLTTHLLVDIATQLHRPTGHAINPVPLTEARRIPSASEIVAVHRIAREIEAEARRSGDLFDWPRLGRLGSALAAWATRFRDRVLEHLAENGVDVADAAQMLLALRRSDPHELERRAQVPVPAEMARLEPWKAGQVRRFATAIEKTAPDLSGTRVVLAVLEVHDVVRDALATALPRRGCEVILLPSDATPAQIGHAAVQEDADAIVVGTYNGGALTLAQELERTAAAEGYDGAIVFGGRFNEDAGDDLPRDVRGDLERMGIRCLDRVDDLLPLLATQGSRAMGHD